MRKLLYLVLITLLCSCTTQKPIITQVYERWEVLNVTKYKEDNLSIISVKKVGTNIKIKNLYVKGIDYKKGQYILFTGENQ